MVDPDTAALGRRFGAQSRPSVAISDTGDFVVAWREDEPWQRAAAPPDTRRVRADVWARGFTRGLRTQREGAAVLPAYRMNYYSANEQTDPAVSLDPATGVPAVVYSDDYNSETGGPAELRMRYGFRNVSP